jgi:response regulator RpfG family c-di-GMP phosphodiesterase
MSLVNKKILVVDEDPLVRREIIEEFNRQAGFQFDPKVVEIFLIYLSQEGKVISE